MHESEFMVKFMGLLPPFAVVCTAAAAFAAAWALTRASTRRRLDALSTKFDPQAYRRILSLFRLGSELVGKVPKRGDGIVEILAKLLAMADAVEKVYGGKSTVYSDFFSRYDLREKTSATFVELFMSTAVSKGLKLTRHGISEHLEMIEVVATDGERLFLQEYRYSKPEISPTFFHTPKFNFAGTMEWVWKVYPSGMFLSVRPGKYETEVTFSTMRPQRDEPITTKGLEQLAAGVAEHAAHEGRSYCFIAYGPPGTGKTRYVRSLAAANKLRLLKIDASALPMLGVQEVGFLIEMLQPGLVLIDDFDRAPVDKTTARVLFIFEDLMDRHALTVAVTANDPTKLDAAFLRSKRIGSAKHIGLPDAAERADLIDKLLGVGPRFAGVDRVALVEATEGFSHDDLSGLVERGQREPIAAALEGAKQLRDLAAKAIGGSDAAKPAADKAPDPPPT